MSILPEKRRGDSDPHMLKPAAHRAFGRRLHHAAMRDGSHSYQKRPKAEDFSSWFLASVIGVAILLFVLSRHFDVHLAIPVGIDLLLTAWVLLVLVNSSPVLMVATLVGGYYSLVFPFCWLTNAANVSEQAAIGTLTHCGLVLETDLVRYAILFLVFKSVFIFCHIQWSRRTPLTNWEDTNWSTKDLGNTLILLGSVTVALLFLERSIGLFGAMQKYLISLLAIGLFHLRVFPRNTFSRLFLVSVIVVGSFLITRSRYISGIVLLYFIALEWERLISFQKLGVVFRNLQLIKIGSIAIVALLTIALYGVWRNVDGKHISLVDAITKSSGFESQGESGLMYLFGTHITGCADSNCLPPFMYDGLRNKVLRGVPTMPDGNMTLADRYTLWITPQVFDDGAGWAFSSLAEWYMLGGIGGLVVYAAVLAGTVAVLTRYSDSLYWRVLGILIGIQMFRTESSIILYQILAGLFAIACLKSLEFLVRKRVHPVLHMPTPLSRRARHPKPTVVSTCPQLKGGTNACP